ncbi:hypothetical protein C0991_005216 [Blastosporella zonata]|nr:hypothetical protein C0991_005216 [Blastosporella zonata]
MSRIPPNLLYLTIYNPTLKPLGPVPEDDEDAEEQAHILFYTSKERAVSRDRMLRQVGLAKALVNFSDMFNGIDMCNNVHSQSKRMIMVSPEPDFWIHAGVEVAKVPRVPSKKAKDKPKSSEKGKEKETDNTPVYDYQEGSVHDLALRADILRGYEQFKLIHGSFTSILSTIGQEGLELQLERFFTVWAWSWNLEDGAEFGEQLGIALHPSFSSLRATLDNYSHQLPNRVSPVFIKPPYVVPSPQYSHPTSVLRHLLSLIPPSPPPSECASHAGTIRGRRASDGDTPNGKDPPKASSSSSFLGMPAVNVKWGWPVALTFGKGASKRPALEETKLESKVDDDAPSTEVEEASESNADTSPSTEPIGLDPHALEDAISEDTSPVQGTTELPAASEELSGDIKSHGAATFDGELPITAPSPPALSSINVHLAILENPLLTERHKVYYIINDRTMLAFIGLDEGSLASQPDLPQSALALLDDIDTLLSAELTKTLTPDQLPTLSKILQPTDTHIVSARQYTISSPNFSTNSSYLYDAQELQTLDPDISEVFSRGLNPQHWHIARRGLSASAIDEHGTQGKEEVYMQIFRKEASLSDVDNVLAGVVRRCGLADGAV